MLFRIFIAALFGISVSHSAFAAETDNNNVLKNEGSWPQLKESIVDNANLSDGDALFQVDAPYRAHDAATVPIKITQLDTGLVIRALKLVVDENPAPVAAEITFGEAMHPIVFETRIRVNQYSNVRVIAETDTASFMNGRFVKASGGCSAPASKDPQTALRTMGQMRLKLFGEAPAQSNSRREAQLMIRHPNYSGLQRNQITQLFVAAHFIDKLEVFQGGDKLFAIEGGISISENPVFRFQYRDNGAEALRVRAEDTDGNVFEKMLLKRDLKS